MRHAVPGAMALHDEGTRASQLFTGKQSIALVSTGPPSIGTTSSRKQCSVAEQPVQSLPQQSLRQTFPAQMWPGTQSVHWVQGAPVAAEPAGSQNGLPSAAEGAQVMLAAQPAPVW
jgi:hypothetical protein